MAMPMEDRSLGSTRSESRPAMGEIIAWHSGLVIMINPAVNGLNPLAYCKYKLKRKETAHMAL
jgi:hypothetical protein